MHPVPRRLAALLLLASLAHGLRADEASDWALLESRLAERPATKDAFDAHWKDVADLCAKFLSSYPDSTHATDVRYVLGRQTLRRDPAAAILLLTDPEVARKHPGSHVLVIRAHVALGQPDQARAALQALEAIGEPGRRFLDAARIAIGDQKEMPNGTAVRTGEAPPALAGETLAGEPFDLASLAGKVVLVDFWATWCGPCKAEMPNVKAAYEAHHASGLEIVGVSLDKDRAALRAYVEANGIPWTQLFDGKGWQNEIAQAYGVRGIPFMVLIGRDGKVRTTDLRGAKLEPAIRAALEEGADSTAR